MSTKPLKHLTVNAPFFQEIKDDHQQLQKLIADLDELIENRLVLSDHPRQFLELIDQLVDQLALHFTLEEAYGYFEHALEEAPRFHDQAVTARPAQRTARHAAADRRGGRGTVRR